MQDMFDGVQLFVNVVEAGGFAKAGERLSLTRSAVGKTIARLETRLGVQLFQRTTRSLVLTEDGQQYYERCIRAMRELRAAEAQLEQGRNEVTGRLRISLPVLFGRHCVAPVLRSFAVAHPKLELELYFSDHHVDLIADGFDLAIRCGELGDSPSLKARSLPGLRKVLCASPGYLAVRGIPHSIESLADHDLIPYWRNDRSLPWHLPDKNHELVEMHVKSRLRFDDLEVIADAAVEGMGLAWIPEWLIAHRIAANDLVEVWADRPSVQMQCHVVWPAAQHLPLRSRLAIDTLINELPSKMGVKG